VRPGRGGESFLAAPPGPDIPWPAAAIPAVPAVIPRCRPGGGRLRRRMMTLCSNRRRRRPGCWRRRTNWRWCRRCRRSRWCSWC